jgi:hypothetical protein
MGAYRELITIPTQTSSHSALLLNNNSFTPLLVGYMDEAHLAGHRPPLYLPLLHIGAVLHSASNKQNRQCPARGQATTRESAFADML